MQFDKFEHFINKGPIEISESSKMIEMSHPFDEDFELSTINGFNNFNHDDYFDLINEKTMNYEVFDDTPMAWFKMQFTQIMLVTGYKMLCKDSNFGFNTYLSYALDSNRKLKTYKEDQKKVCF